LFIQCNHLVVFSDNSCDLFNVNISDALSLDVGVQYCRGWGSFVS